MDYRAIKYRLANDFQLAVINMLGVIALVGISPFTVLRAVDGQWLAFSADLLIQAGILICVLRAWFTGDTHVSSMFLAYFLGVMVIVAIFILGGAAEHWFYPAIVSGFFLVDRRHALAITLIGVFVLLVTDVVQLPTTIEKASYFVTAIVCALLSYAFAYRTAMQREQLETLASRDALTGIYNRRTMLDELERAHQAFARDQSPCGILLVDIDHFKRINDRFGHQTGDQVLLDLAKLIEQTVRKNDRVFRFGGEEFLILMQQASHEGMSSLAEKLRSAVDIKINDLDDHAITASIGGAQLLPNESIESWFDRADKSLYAAKDAGRNRVMIDAS